LECHLHLLLVVFTSSFSLLSCVQLSLYQPMLAVINISRLRKFYSHQYIVTKDISENVTCMYMFEQNEQVLPILLCLNHSGFLCPNIIIIAALSSQNMHRFEDKSQTQWFIITIFYTTKHTMLSS